MGNNEVAELLTSSLLNSCNYAETRITLISILSVLKRENNPLFLEILRETVKNIDSQNEHYALITDIKDDTIRNKVAENLKEYSEYLKSQI